MAIAPQPGWAEELVEKPTTTVDEWVAQIEASLVQITDVRVESTATGLQVVLETADGSLDIPETHVVGNALIADIPNAAIAQDFEKSAPIEGIALVSVTNLPGDRVRIAITGTDAPPVAEVRSEGQNLVLAVTLGDTATVAADDAIQVVVTGEQDNYFVPDTSTATRTDSRLLDIPQSVQVIPQQILQDQQILRIDDALRNVSGVVGSYGAFGAGETLTIRGFSTDNFSNGPILRDGFRVYDNLGVQETANLEQIEVLRGPSSVLYGQNDPGGIINLVTKQPLSEPLYEFQLQAGSFGLIRPSVDISGSLTEDASLRYRLNAAYQRKDGFQDFETNYERFFVAPVLAWDLDDRTTLSVSLEYLDDRAPYEMGLVALGNGVVDVPLSRITNEPDDFRHSESLTLGYNLEHQLSDDWTLRNAFRYVRQDYDIQVYLPFTFDEATGIITRFPADRRYHSDDYSAQANIVGEFSTGSIEHTLLAGVDLNFNRFDERFTHVDQSSPSPLNIFDPEYGLVPRPDLSNQTPFLPFDTEYDRVGVFLQDQVALSDQFIVVGSLRYDSVDFRNTAEETRRSDSAWSPRVGLVYQPTETTSLYASYSRSFVPNSSQGVDGDFLDPQVAKGFEVGVKAELFDDNLLVTLAYFDITKQNVPVVVDILTGASAATGEQRSQGIELDLSGEILPGWNVIGFYAYTDARVTEDDAIPVGNRLPNAPRHSTGLWTTYEIQSGSLQGLGVGLGVNYVSNRQGNLNNNFEIGDYFLTNAALFYRRDRWQLALNINNLFDVEYIKSANAFSRTTGITPGEPLSIVGSISVQF